MARFLAILLCFLWFTSVAYGAPHLLVLVAEDPAQQALALELSLTPDAVRTTAVAPEAGFAEWSATRQSEHVRSLATEHEALAVAWLTPGSPTLYLWAPGEGRDLIVAVEAETDEPVPELAMVARTHLAQLAHPSTPQPAPAPVAAEKELPPEETAPSRWWLWTGAGAHGGGDLRAGGHLGLGFGRAVQLRLQLGSRRPLSTRVGSEWDGELSVLARKTWATGSVAAGLGAQLRNRRAELAAPRGPMEVHQWWRPAWGPSMEVALGRSARIGAWTGMTVADRARIWEAPDGGLVLADPLVQWSAGLRLAVPLN